MARRLKCVLLCAGTTSGLQTSSFGVPPRVVVAAPVVPEARVPVARRRQRRRVVVARDLLGLAVVERVLRLALVPDAYLLLSRQ